MLNSLSLGRRFILSSMLDGKSGVRAGAGLRESWFLACTPFRPSLTQSMTAAVLPTGHFDVAAGMPNPPCRLGSLILSAASCQASRSRWAVPPVGHSLPWPMRVATVFRIFSSNCEKKGRVFAVASSPLPRKSAIGFRHARVSWNAVKLCDGASSSIVPVVDFLEGFFLFQLKEPSDESRVADGDAYADDSISDEVAGRPAGAVVDCTSFHWKV